METIPVEPVTSDVFSHVGHDGNETIRLVFKRSSKFFDYGNTTLEEYDKFRSDSSLGKHYALNIRGKKPIVGEPQGSDWNGNGPAEAAPTPKPITIIEAPAEVVQTAENQNREVEKVATQTSLLVQSANSIKVIDPTTQAQASEHLLAIAAMRKQVSNTFKPMKDAAFRAHRVICEQEAKIDGPLADAERVVKGQIGNFVAEQQRIAREAEKKAREAELERARLEAQAESERLALEDALVLEAEGNMQAAEAVMANPAPAPIRYVAPAPVAPQVAQVSGVSMREDWDFRIVNENLIPREYLTVNESAIRAMGKITKGKAKIAGVEFYGKQVVSASHGK